VIHINTPCRQIFEAAWERRDPYRGEASPYTYLQAIARNEARHLRSWEQRVQFDSVDQDEADEVVAPELVTDELEKRDDRYRLQKALERLPAKHRRALNRRARPDRDDSQPNSQRKAIPP
jgi:DNA-directed RNA polymerase specialized sigma24 family protein